MRALPELLARGLDVRLNTPVTEVASGTVRTDGGAFAARSVVVSTNVPPVLPVASWAASAPTDSEWPGWLGSGRSCGTSKRPCSA